MNRNKFEELALSVSNDCRYYLGKKIKMLLDNANADYTSLSSYFIAETLNQTAISLGSNEKFGWSEGNYSAPKLAFMSFLDELESLVILLSESDLEFYIKKRLIVCVTIIAQMKGTRKI